jgi:hypothetical protein
LSAIASHHARPVRNLGPLPVVRPKGHAVSGRSERRRGFQNRAVEVEVVEYKLVKMKEREGALTHQQV